MKPAKLLTLALFSLPALALAHPGHPGHEPAAAFLDSPALGFVAGLIVVGVLIAARAFPRRARTTATRRR